MRRLLSFVLLASLAVAAPASALTLAEGRFVTGLAGTSTGVLTAEPTIDGANVGVNVVALRGASAPVRVGSLGDLGCGTAGAADLAASDAAVALATPCQKAGISIAVVAVGPSAAALTSPEVCRGSTAGGALDGVAASGTRVAYVDRCSSAAPAVVLFDLATGTATRVPIMAKENASTVRVRLAGDTLAYAAGIPGATVSLRVVDLATGAVRTAYDSDVVDFDVAADGTLALLRRDRAQPCGARVLIALPGQATPFGVVDCARPLGIRVARGRVAYAGRDGLELFDTTSGTRTARQRVPSLVEPGGRTRLAFDGRRLVYTVPSCRRGGEDVMVDDVTAAAPGPVSAACPFSVPAQSPRLRRGLARLVVRCPQGCRHLGIVVRQGRRRRTSTNTAIAGLRRGAATVTVSVEGRDGVARRATRRVVLR